MANLQFLSEQKLKDCFLFEIWFLSIKAIIAAKKTKGIVGI